MSSIETESSPYRLLRQLMAARRMQPGDRVPSIRDLARRFGVSVVAVRDALVQAEREGYIEIRPRSGAFVRLVEHIRAEPPAEWIVEFPLRVVDGYQLHLCHTRELLEVEMAGQAAERCRPQDLLPVREALESWLRANTRGDLSAMVDADRRFHIAIAQMAGNPVSTSILDQCLQQQYMQECTLFESPGDREEVVAIHIAIYEALRDRDAERARDAMSQHMKYLENNIHAMLLTTPGQDPAAKPAGIKNRSKVLS